MWLLEHARRHPLALAALGGSVVGVVIGLFLPIRPPPSVDARDPAWELPAPAATRAYSDAAATAARGAQFWGEPARASSPQRANWMLRAIALRPEPRIAIVQGGRSEIEWIRLRGPLPDGSVLVALDRDTAWTERDGCRSQRRLYPLPEDAGNDPCADPATARASPPAATGSPTTQKTDTR